MLCRRPRYYSPSTPTCSTVPAPSNKPPGRRPAAVPSSAEIRAPTSTCQTFQVESQAMWVAPQTLYGRGFTFGSPPLLAHNDPRPPAAVSRRPEPHSTLRGTSRYDPRQHHALWLRHSVSRLDSIVIQVAFSRQRRQTPWRDRLSGGSMKLRELDEHAYPSHLLHRAAKASTSPFVQPYSSRGN